MLRTAIIGLGKAARDIHLPACDRVENIEIVAGVEPNAEQAQKTTSQYLIPQVYDDTAKMLAQEAPQLVIIVTPPNSHYELTKLALEHNSHVLVEKPFMSSVAQADELIDLANEKNLCLRVNTQYRHMAHYAESHQRILQGDYGRLYLAQVWQQMWHPPIEDETSWRAELKRATLYEFGSHPIDLLCRYFDDLPTRMSAVIPRVFSQYDSDVLVQLTLHFPDERLATVLLNRVSHAPERYLEMRLDCEQASLRVSVGGVARFGVQATRYQGRTTPSVRFSWVKGGEARVEQGGNSEVIATEPQKATHLATARLLQHLLDDIATGADNQQAIHARNILHIIMQGYEAAESKTTVELQYRES